MEKTRHFLHLDKLHPLPRKIIVGVVGGIIFVAGIVMIVTPGPAFVLIPIGLLFLASEFKCAEKGSKKMFELFSRARNWWRKKRATR